MCDGQLQNITFNSVNDILSPATIAIGKGIDCESIILHEQQISSISNGNNSIDLNQTIKIKNGEYYFFSVASNDGTEWRIRFNPQSQVEGYLSTYTQKNSSLICDRKYYNYDWKFSVNVIKSTSQEPENSPIYSKNIDLFILAGQSNATGRKGDGAQYPSDPDNLDSKIKLNYEYIYSSKSTGWISMQTQNGFFPKGYFGPEVSFSRKLKKNGYNPRIFKYTRGSTSIYENWKTPGQGGLYEKMVKKLNHSIEELISQGYKVNLKGLIWIQGESDAENSTFARAYESNLSKIITDFRKNVAKNIKLPIILGVDEQHVFIKKNPEVLLAQKNIAKNDPNIKFTSMIGLQKSDGTHLSPSGLIEHGEIIYNAMNDLVNNSSVEPNDLNPVETCLISAKGSTVSKIAKKSWGQSFQAECNGNIQHIIFNSASKVSSSATIEIYDGENCKKSILYTQTIPQITNGDNIISIQSDLEIEEGNFYFVQVTSDNNNPWKVRHTDKNVTTGNLRTYFKNKPISTCSKIISDYDWDFSASIVPNLESSKSYLTKKQHINNNELLSRIQITIYPNPSNGLFSIESRLNIIQAEIFNIHGQKIQDIKTTNNSFSIQNLIDGLYFLKIKTDEGSVTKKILKNRSLFQ
ncbi:MAG: T9SS type A sorting domain-containing protein [Flavobacteriales bacterium]|nr:T9SS type A sorting domain-containing protein [Flavobacteriales bacterium]